MDVKGFTYGRFQLFLCIFVSLFGRSVQLKCTDICTPTDLVGLVFGFMQCAGITFEVTETTGVDLDFSFCLCKGPVNPSGAKFFVTIDHVGADPTAADDFDEGTEPLKIPINNLGGNKAKCADNIITILGDSVPENTEMFTLTLSFESCADKDNNLCMVDTGYDKITVDVVDDDSQTPVLGSGCDCASQTWYILDRASYAVTEPSTATGTKTLEITIIRKGVTTHNDGSVDLTVVALSASETADYVNFGTETINFAAAEFMKTFDITINSDDLHESTEEFLIYLSNPGPTAATNQEDLGDLTTAVISIYDYDRIGTWYYLGCAEYTVTESDTMIDIVVKRRGDTVSATTGFVELSTTDITALSTSDNIDYTALTSVPVIFEEDATCSTPITLTITDDMSEEPLEHLEIALTLTAIADRSELADLNKAFVTIIDDDSKVTWYSLDCGFYTATEGDTDPVMIPITITKSGDLSQETTVSLSTMDITATGGDDYTTKMPETITFTADTETVETSQLVILADDIAEGNEYLQVELSLPADAPDGDALSDVNKAIVLIYDDDTPVTWYSLDCGFYTATEEDTDPVMIPITITKSGDLSQETTHSQQWISLQQEAMITPPKCPTITFTADTETVETSQLVILADDIAEGNEYLQVALSLPADAPDGDALSDVNKAIVLIYDDDTPVTWYSLDCGFYTATEEDTDPVMIPITITKSGDLSQETTVSLSTMDITATGGAALDYTTKMPETITFTADTDTVETSQLVILPDDIAEGNEYLQVALSLPADAPDGDALSDVNKAIVLIYDDDTPVTWYSLDCGFYTATEEDTDPVMIPITITKSGDLSQETTVSLSTMDITATGGDDYTTKMPETITFTADTDTVETSQLVILPDDIAEGNEYLQVALSLPAVAPDGDALSDVNKAIVLIYDDDTPVTWYSLDCGFYTATEGDTDPVMIPITITKSGDLSQETTVSLSTMDITATGGAALDYTTKMPETITFTADTDTVETSQLVILADDIAEGNEYLQVALSLPADAPDGDALSDVNKAIVLIYDDDTPVTWYSLDCGFYTATEEDTDPVMIPITITKRGDLSQETTVSLSTMDITATGGAALDYTIKMPETITFTADTETVETSQLVILPDDIAEGNEYLQVTLSLPADAPDGDALSDVNKAIVLIYDDDAPVTWYSLDCGFYTATETDAGTVMIPITITKRGDMSQETTVLLSTMDITATGGGGLDYTIKSGEEITFTANIEAVETSQLVILSDDIAEGNEYLQVELSLPSDAPVGDALSDLNKALVLIYDDDEPVTWYSLDCGFYTATETDAGTVMIPITITKSGDLSQETTVLLSTMDITATGGGGLDFTIKSGEEITFTANTEAVETSQLVILSDDIAEGNEHLQVELSLPSDAPVGDALSDLNKALVLIYDDDAPVTWYSLDCGFYTATETDAGNVMIPITITKRGDLSQGTTVLLSTMDITATGGVGLDYTIKSGEEITFTANTEAVKTSQLVILSDDIAEGNEYLQVELSLPSDAPVGDALSDLNKAMVLIYDDDAPVCDGGNGCANNGICIGTDVCVCGGGFTGNLCQFGSANPGKLYLVLFQFLFESC
ncbi:uncharacterized protein [Amphiura filiformis]|uniref:uncharacterized protein n=1 Tax=Amphiura filiformis TaxID=82378 RepID=UPI003B21332D